MQRNATQRNAMQRNAMQRNAMEPNATQRNATYHSSLQSDSQRQLLRDRLGDKDNVHEFHSNLLYSGKVGHE